MNVREDKLIFFSNLCRIFVLLEEHWRMRVRSQSNFFLAIVPILASKDLLCEIKHYSLFRLVCEKLHWQPCLGLQ